MKKNSLIILFFLSASLLAQQADIDKLKQYFESFEYQKVINLADKLIQSGSLSDSLLTEVYEMQAISYYALGDEASAKISFRQLIKINKDYSPDPSKISPKVINFFNDIKNSMAAELQSNSTAKDSLSHQTSIQTKLPFDYRSYMLKNIFLPGWGQLSSSQFLKGGIISGASLILMGGMISYIIDTNKKQNDYLNETELTLMQLKYENYNKSYKIRNIFIASYLAVWLYSQIDLILFSNNPDESTNMPEISAFFKSIPTTEFILNFKINL
ncbi:hypothetical protein ABRY23_11125 [Melioribacteraceae bacterium 4301-Me]|uniref:hypothetical protein n=1 Tax=Pyranulibacter aquaticus TaxID=3163344 RepID=UPI00359916CA